MRLRTTAPDWQAMRDDPEAEGYEAGLLCPRHALAAFEDTANYVVDISLGEVIAETLSDKPRWRLVWTPKNRKDNIEMMAV